MIQRCSIFVMSIVFFSVSCVYAETIKLKNGKTVEGKILEKNSSSIKVDISGLSITYYVDEIENIDGVMISIPKETSSSASLAARNPADIFQDISPAIVRITTKTADG
ncbi:MAG: hypothetical protein PHV55_08355, partial [Candidatus Omnitrophica bacterium]|nr:hypothetical protein [Candidatus Omnitrophota bacterium]